MKSKMRTGKTVFISIIILSVVFLACCGKTTAIQPEVTAPTETVQPTAQATSPSPETEPEPAVSPSLAFEPVPEEDAVGIIYLTFDDGPSEYTGDLLDILAGYGVKATFFVTGDSPNHYDCIGRAYSEGHSIGIHCMHHEGYNMYRSFDDYWADFDEIDSLIYTQTGIHTRLMRFPGGSSNQRAGNVPNMMNRLATKVTEKGYVYFDWNASSGDAKETPPSVEDTLKKMQQYALSCGDCCLMLNHDTKPNTVEAVDLFIPWAYENGYIFKPLTVDSPTAHHVIG